MVVFILERVSPSLRGQLTRWMLEPKTGIFVGRINAKVRDILWEKIKSRRGVKGAGLMVRTSNTEQGFVLESIGDTSREIVDFEGLQLVRIPNKDGKSL